MRILLTAISLLFVVSLSAQFKGVIVNEFSQGDMGSREYIELLVVGKRTCNDSTADIRGWIVDDQNGWYGTTNGAAGHYRFKDVPNWSAIPFGSIILLYNSASGEKNLSITSPDDPTDANHDYTYILPINSNAYLEEHDLEPTNVTGPNYIYPAASSTTGYGPATNQWTFHIALNNTNGDVISVISRNKRDSAFFSIGYGYTINAGFRSPAVSITNVGGGMSTGLTDSNYTVAARWNISGVPGFETPGAPNGGINTSWIQAMRITPVAMHTYTTACSNGPYSFFGQTIITTGPYTVLYTNNNACVDTNDLYVVIKKTDIRDTIACDSLVYKGITYTTNTTITHIISSVVVNCDSIVQILNIKINKSSSSLTRTCMTQGQTFVFNGQPITSSGIYNYTLTNANGCDSIARLYIVFKVLQTDTLRSCNTVTFNGNTYSASTILYDTARSVLVPGCDSFIRKTVILISPAINVFVTGCAVDGSTYNFNGQLLNVTGTYTANLATSSGCDSIVKLYIVFKKTLQQTHSGCDSVVFNNVKYYQSAIVRDTIKSLVTNCDSLITTHNIIVNQSRLTNVTACSQTAYLFFGQTLTSSGSYSHVLSSSSGCDSIIRLYLVVTQTQSQNLTGCDSVIFKGTTYYSPITVIDTIKSVTSGCDSIIRTSTITINHNNHRYFTVCLSTGTYNFYGQPLTTSGNYIVQFSTPNCDSIIHLQLLVASRQTQTVTGCDSVLFNGQFYYANAQIVDSIKSLNTGCDSIYKTTNIVISAKPETYSTLCLAQGQQYNFDGQLINAPGNYVSSFSRGNLCDSIVHLYVVMSAIRTQTVSGCSIVALNGINYTSSTSINDTIKSVVTNCDSLINVVNIVVNQKPTIQITKDTTICKGDAAALTATSGTNQINWTGFGNTNSIIVSPSTTTSYTVAATDNLGCINTANVVVTVNDFTLNLYSITNPVLTGRNVVLQTTSSLPYTVYSWQPSSLFINPTSKQQSFVADTSLNIYVAGTTPGGCKDTAYLSLIVTPLDDIYVPTGFTPNGDGKNDEAKVVGSLISSLDFKIFNRWGQLVFATTEKNKGWDGKVAGKIQPSGTYVYVVKAKKTNGQVIEKRGTIILIR